VDDLSRVNGDLRKEYIYLQRLETEVNKDNLDFQTENDMLKLSNNKYYVEIEKLTKAYHDYSKDNDELNKD